VDVRRRCRKRQHENQSGQTGGGVAAAIENRDPRPRPHPRPRLPPRQHPPPSIDLSCSPASAAVLPCSDRARRRFSCETCSHASAAPRRALAADMASPPAEQWRWLSPLGGRTKMAEIAASPLSGGNGVTDDGGRDPSSTERHLVPAVRPSQTKASLYDGPGRQQY
jgi:hypothetical protein